MKLMNAFSVFLLLLMMNGLNAQEVVFEKTLGQEGSGSQDLVQTPEQHYLIVGRIEPSGNGNAEGLLVKVNRQGDTLLKKRYGPPTFNSITRTPDDHYLMIASENPRNTDNPSVDITKIDSAGNVIWQNELGGPNPKVAYDIQHINNNSYVVTGFAFRTDSGRRDADVFGMKLSSGGQSVDWIEYFGGTEFEEAITAKPTQDDGLLFAGGTYSFSQNPGETDDLYLIKTNLQGDTLWTFTYGVEGQYDWANDWSQLANGDYLVTGLKDNSDNQAFQDGEVMLIRVSENGSLVWDKSFIAGTGRAEGRLLTKINDDHFAVSGISTTSNNGIDAFVTEIDSAGEEQWTKNLDFGNDRQTDIPNTITSNTHHQLLIAGAKNQSSDYSGEMFFAKLYTSISGIHSDADSYSSLTVYPNPANPGEPLSVIHPEKSTNPETIELLDIKGQVQKHKRVPNNSDQIRFKLPHDLEPGLYFLKMEASNSRSFIAQVILK